MILFQCLKELYAPSEHARLRVISPCTAGTGLMWHVAKGLGEARKFSGGVQAAQLFQVTRRTFWLSVESLSEFDIYSLCACDVCFQTALSGPFKLASCFYSLCHTAKKHNKNSARHF